MNCTVNSQRLAQELRLINKIAPAKAALPILSNVLLTAAEGKLQFYATDLEMGVSTECEATATTPGTTALPAARLLALVEQFPDAAVVLQEDGNGIRITCGTYHTSRLQAQPTADFPLPPHVEGIAHTLSGSGLRRLLACTRYAVDEANMKFVLKGALLDLTPERAAMVATDARRVAVATMAHTGTSAAIVVPVKTMDMLSGSFEGAEFTMTVGPRHLFFAAGPRLLISRMLDTPFPAYQRAFANPVQHVIGIDRLPFAAALRRVGLSADEDNRIFLDFQPGTLDLSARSASVGNAEERLMVTYDGAPIRLCVNWKLVLDTLEAATQLSVTIKISSPSTPFMIEDGEQHICAVVPMRENAEVKAS